MLTFHLREYFCHKRQCPVSELSNNYDLTPPSYDMKIWSIFHTSFLLYWQGNDKQYRSFMPTSAKADHPLKSLLSCLIVWNSLCALWMKWNLFANRQSTANSLWQDTHMLLPSSRNGIEFLLSAFEIQLPPTRTYVWTMIMQLTPDCDTRLVQVTFMRQDECSSSCCLIKSNTWINPMLMKIAVIRVWIIKRQCFQLTKLWKKNHLAGLQVF